MKCEKAQLAINALLDGELSRWSAWRIRGHLAHCPACTQIHQESEALGVAARSWREVAAPPALQARIAAALAATPRQADRSTRMKEQIWMNTQRWGTIGIAATLLAILWSGSRRNGTALAAVIRATEAAPAVHFVGHGSRGTEMEGWWVDHVGSVMRIARGHEEQLDVDDLKQQFHYTVRERPASQPAGQRPGPDRAAGPPERPVLERRVDVMPSALADPKQAAQQRQSFTFTGVLNQMVNGHTAKQISITWAVKKGRRLRRIDAPAQTSVFYVDPRTDRVVLVEDWGMMTDAQGEFMRVQIEYPEPASVDRQVFEFKIPPGVPVFHPTSGAPRPRRVLSKQEKIWLAEQQEVNVCLDHLTQLREALRRYANDHHGEWPESLTPALDPYVKDHAVFLCPRDHAPGATSYIYHRLTGARAARALAAMNDMSPRDINHPRPGQEVLIECHHHPGVLWHIDDRGMTSGPLRSGAGKK